MLSRRKKALVYYADLLTLLGSFRHWLGPGARGIEATWDFHHQEAELSIRTDLFQKTEDIGPLHFSKSEYICPVTRAFGQEVGCYR